MRGPYSTFWRTVSQGNSASELWNTMPRSMLGPEIARPSTAMLPEATVHGAVIAEFGADMTSPAASLAVLAEGANSKLAYYEVTNAQHFDAFIDNAAAPGYDSRAVPLHRYLNQALDIMWNHLRSNAAIPPSQVVRTTPRGGTPGSAPAITAANVPSIAATPAAGDAITFGNNVLVIPD